MSYFNRPKALQILEKAVADVKALGFGAYAEVDYGLLTHGVRTAYEFADEAVVDQQYPFDLNVFKSPDYAANYYRTVLLWIPKTMTAGLPPGGIQNIHMQRVLNNINDLISGRQAGNVAIIPHIERMVSSTDLAVTEWIDPVADYVELQRISVFKKFTVVNFAVIPDDNIIPTDSLRGIENAMDLILDLSVLETPIVLKNIYA